MTDTKAARAIPAFEEYRQAKAASQEARIEAPWPDRKPVPEEAISAPPLPPELVPEPMRPWLLDVAVRACIPLEFVAVPAVVGLGSIVGRSLGIRPETRNDWTVIPNLWGGIVARPGTLKSHAVSEGTAPIGPLEAAAEEQFENDRDTKEAHKRVLEARLSGLKRPKGPAMDEETAAGILREIRESEATERRYRTNDGTVEKLGELLRENPRGLLLLRDELAGWLRTLDRSERAGEREFFLEAWNGTGSFKFDRIGRGTVHVPAMCLSVVGGIQPGKLRAYITEAIVEGAGADGLLQRLQLIVWPDGTPEWTRCDTWPNGEAKRAAFDLFRRVDEMDVTAFGAERDTHHENAPPFLRFSTEAQDLFNAWRDTLEKRLRSPEMEKTPAFTAHLAKYRSLMPSLALLFDMSERVTGLRPEAGGVGLASARRAAAWCDYLEAHARKVYAHEVAPGVTTARLLSVRIEEGEVLEGATVKSIYRTEWAGLGTSEGVWAGLRVLEKLGWVRVEERPTGGRPSDVIHLHPTLRREAP